MIFIRVDASRQNGLGHLMRCIALAEVLKLGAEVVFVIRQPDEVVLSLIEDKGCSCRVITDLTNLEDEIELINKWVRLYNPLAIIFDGYYLDHHYQSKIVHNGIFVHFGLLGRDSYSIADIIVNPNPWATPDLYKGRLKEKAKLLVGADYVMIGSSFKKINKVEPQKIISSILLTFGGSSAGAMIFEVYKAIKILPYQFDLIVGPTIGDSMPVNKLTNASLHYNLFEMASMMEKADLAVCAAGTTCWELCHLGVPFINYTLTDNQAVNAEFLQQKDISVSIGDIRHFDGNLLRKTLNELAENYNKRKIMSERGRALIDGLGADRVAAEILGFQD